MLLRLRGLKVERWVQSGPEGRLAALQNASMGSRPAHRDKTAMNGAQIYLFDRNRWMASINEWATCRLFNFDGEPDGLSALIGVVMCRQPSLAAWSPNSGCPARHFGLVRPVPNHPPAHRDTTAVNGAQIYLFGQEQMDGKYQ